MSTLKERLELCLQENPKTSKSGLAKHCGVSKAAVTGWFSGGDMTAENASKAAEYFHVSTDWLSQGKGSKIRATSYRNPPDFPQVVFVREAHHEGYDHERNIKYMFAPEIKEQPKTVQKGPPMAARLPLISWVQAGSWCEAIDNFQPGDADTWLECPVRTGPRAYCLEVVGHSMYVPDGSGYAEGEIIFVDPDLEPTHGSDVIVRSASGSVTFKRLQSTQDGMYLLALNPAWPERIIHATEDTIFCGVVVFSGRFRKQGKT
jgi:SOS-response transcriptional repressor LexA